jgi:Ca-activated chloride channel homolog
MKFNGKAMILASLVSLVCCNGASAREIVLVVDSSASMNGQTSDRVRRIDAAKDAFRKVMPYLSEHQVGLVMFGHRTPANSEGCCSDIENVVPIGAFSPAGFNQAVMSMRPTGNTPLAKSLEVTRDMLVARSKDVSKEVIVLTDGNDTCNGHPQDVAAEMNRLGINVRIHVVGFAIKPEEEAQLRRIAQACDGTYHTANSAAALGKALKDVIEISPRTGPVALTAVEKALVARLKDENPNVRITAATALKKRKAVAAVPMLIERVQDDVYSLGYGTRARSQHSTS